MSESLLYIYIYIYIYTFSKKWYELDCFITNFSITPGRWSQLDTITVDGADYRGKDVMLQSRRGKDDEEA